MFCYFRSYSGERFFVLVFVIVYDGDSGGESVGRAAVSVNNTCCLLPIRGRQTDKQTDSSLSPPVSLFVTPCLGVHDVMTTVDPRAVNE